MMVFQEPHSLCAHSQKQHVLPYFLIVWSPMKNNKHSLWRFIYKLHRYIGLTSSLVLIMLAVTGIALNHTAELQLDQRTIKSTAILDWYGIKSPDKLRSFATRNHWLTQMGQKIYFDQHVFLENQSPLLGVVETEQFIVIAFYNSLQLLTHSGELIEKIPFAAIEHIGSGLQQSIVIQSSQGYTSSNDGLLSWQPYLDKPVTWSTSQATPEILATPLQQSFVRSILPVERVILDLHSGRLFGTFGVIIVDISGIFLLILAISGCAIWLKHKLRSLRHARRTYRQR
ncbi:MAG TPA: PepSY domain-containing protein [Methylococcaceae bacterium]|nr:PepSY domain-containing protein [Methylococcaceae bacterium]